MLEVQGRRQWVFWGLESDDGNKLRSRSRCAPVLRTERRSGGPSGRRPSRGRGKDSLHVRRRCVVSCECFGLHVEETAALNQPLQPLQRLPRLRLSAPAAPQRLFQLAFLATRQNLDEPINQIRPETQQVVEMFFFFFFLFSMCGLFRKKCVSYMNALQYLALMLIFFIFLQL